MPLPTPPASSQPPNPNPSPNPNPDPPNPAAGLQPDEAAALNASLQALRDSVTARGHIKKRPRTTEEDPLVLAGRYVPKAIDLFANINLAFQIGVASRGNFENLLEPRGDVIIDSMSRKEKLEQYWVYKHVVNLVTGLEEKVNEWARERGTSEHYLRVVAKIHQGAISGRSDDTSRLKEKGHYYIPVNRKDPLIPAINEIKSKANRGCHHVMMARLLCPVDKLGAFDKDPVGFCKKIETGEIKLNTKDWPALLYDEALLSVACVLSGLLKGYFLLRVARHILTSPSSTWDGRVGATGTRPPVSAKMSITHITPQHIAYSAVQARYLLTTQETWRSHNPCDGAFNYRKFYRNIVEMFSDGGKWATDTLAWWDGEVFGHAQDSDNDEASDSDDEGGLVARCMAQRDLQNRVVVRTPSLPPSRSPSPPPNPTGNDAPDAPLNNTLDGHTPGSGSVTATAAAAAATATATATGAGSASAA